MPAPQPRPPDAGDPRQARDVMAFGQEIGRVLSDGRIVGRAEPFAKAFPSSRVVKRAVGLAAWAVLEDIALDATLDELGRLVAETNVRRIAANLGLNKDTVTKHLRTLRDYGFVLQEEERSTESGRYESSRYVLDPSACVERFTVTPPAAQQPSSEPRPTSSDTAPPGPVSEATGRGDAGHGGTGHGEPGQSYRDVVVAHEEQQHQPAGATSSDLGHRLRALGVAGHVADDLLARHAEQRLRDVADAAAAQDLRKPAGWIVSALRDGWDVTDILAPQRAAEARRERQHQAEEADRQATVHQRRSQARSEGWAAAVSAALDDRQLVEAVRRVTTPVAGIRRSSVPLAQAQLVSWAAAVHAQQPGRALLEALAASLADGASPTPAGEELPDPPASGRSAPDLSTRLAAALSHQRQHDRPTPPAPAHAELEIDR